ncbi:MAG TPA: hypothetical protein VLG49_04250 [Rhabdochlamydiaceae bacterium]|nr:hypothetical protein [Rhabdochlamydiaceae bacterium]
MSLVFLFSFEIQAEALNIPFHFEPEASALFDYDVHLSCIPGKSSKVMVCFHGYGGNYQIAYRVKEHAGIEDTLISFNFPDHDIVQRKLNPEQMSFGTIEELLPCLYVLKNSVIDYGMDEIDLYGFSAGGGAIINAIGVLNTHTHDQSLQKIGIGEQEKQTILKAIQRGYVILDTPLKSLEEIIDLRGSCYELEVIARRYRENQFVPIESLQYLNNLSLQIVVHFQEKDDTIFNRDDPLFIERLKKYNESGNTFVILGDDGGHSAPHPSLWQYYADLRQEQKM